MNERVAGKTEGLWAITAYFNPAGYKQRYRNYRVFRERLKVPLVAVELAYCPEFELDPEDAEILIQLRGENVLWQKERLLNVALKALPDACSKVVWVDCDIIFEQDNWAERLCALLDRFIIVQSFSKVFYLPRNFMPEDIQTAATAISHSSYVHAIAQYEAADSVLKKGKDRNVGSYAAGFAWAARYSCL